MKDIVLSLIVIAIFISGYFVMGRFGRFLKEVQNFQDGKRAAKKLEFHYTDQKKRKRFTWKWHLFETDPNGSR